MLIALLTVAAALLARGNVKTASINISIILESTNHAVHAAVAQRPQALGLIGFLISDLLAAFRTQFFFWTVT